MISRGLVKGAWCCYAEINCIWIAKSSWVFLWVLLIYFISVRATHLGWNFMEKIKTISKVCRCQLHIPLCYSKMSSLLLEHWRCTKLWSELLMDEWSTQPCCPVLPRRKELLADTGDSLFLSDQFNWPWSHLLPPESQGLNLIWKHVLSRATMGSIWEGARLDTRLAFGGWQSCTVYPC